jgi:hypothetical protein
LALRSSPKRQPTFPLHFRLRLDDGTHDCAVKWRKERVLGLEFTDVRAS